MRLNDIRIRVNDQTCIGCNACVNDCPSGVLVMDHNKAKLTSDVCLKCAHCFAICPTNAISFDGTGDSILEASPKPPLNSEDFLHHLKLRRSVRQFKPELPSDSIVENIIEAGRLTASASNKQDVRYIVINKDIDHLEDLGINEYKLMQSLAKEGKITIPASLENRSFDRGFLFHNAPCLILTVSSSVESATLATMNMELMLESLGLGSVLVGLFTRPANQSETIRDYLNIKDKELIVNCIAFGYPAIQYYRSAPKLKANITWNTK